MTEPPLGSLLEISLVPTYQMGPTEGPGIVAPVADGVRERAPGAAVTLGCPARVFEGKENSRALADGSSN